ncbi:hypothetical protein KPL78_19150 [Roseomonas sp. HJA6]|uniref:Uncharacterized protein n=2 Tax=Roseomonas alba TaxID=2846776 RepID=A0ABS7ACF4_9PROT|nr:hypothetical protein [Neoroseomonas alba]
MRIVGSREPIVYTRLRDGASFTVPGVFDRQHVEVGFDGDGAPVTAFRTVVYLRLADMPGGHPPQQGDSVVRGGGTWVVAEVQPDAIDAFCLVLGGQAATDVGGAWPVVGGAPVSSGP